MNRNDEKPEMSNPCEYTLRFLKSFRPDHLYKEIEGDLIQKFKKDVKLFGERKLSVKFL